ncbi:MAG: endonuclease domain-containing protein [Alphaproteobacteria bacterium]|nr:endonuclease domain-containing protein [Alphaproteobacteria bacterium]
MPVVRKATRVRRQKFKRTFAKTLRANATDAERLLWSLLRDRRLPVRFRRQQPIGPHIADFFCAAARLVIELDGDHHGTDAATARDETRARFLTTRGYRVLRFPNHEVFRYPHLVLETILRAVHESGAHPAPNPSPKIPDGIFDPTARSARRPYAAAMDPLKGRVTAKRP